MRHLSDDPLPAPDDLGRVHAEAAVRERRVRGGAAGRRAGRRAGRLAPAAAPPQQLTQTRLLNTGRHGASARVTGLSGLVTNVMTVF